MSALAGTLAPSGPTIRQGLSDTLDMVVDKLDRLTATPGGTSVGVLQALRKDCDAVRLGWPRHPLHSGGRLVL